MDAAIAFLLVFSTAESACPSGEAKCRSAVFRHINRPSPNGSRASNQVDSFGLRATKPRFNKKTPGRPGVFIPANLLWRNRLRLRSLLCYAKS
jgi:hypothetical protein